VIFVHQNLMSNRLTYLVHAKSTGELISFGSFSDTDTKHLVLTWNKLDHFRGWTHRQTHRTTAWPIAKQYLPASSNWGQV